MTDLYYKYSDYLKAKYKEKIYKIPINLPITCPNRLDSSGCTFCAENGTGFEACPNTFRVEEQLAAGKPHITKKFGAKKFIAYFQNYTNTFMPLNTFKEYITAAAKDTEVVQISISTRPDCIREDYLSVLEEISSTYGCDINIELGLQTINYHTLAQLNRGHGLAEYVDAVLLIRKYAFSVCTHVILNLPGDEMLDVIETAKLVSALKTNVIKVHSLYIAKNTILCNAYENGKIQICEKDTYLERVITFLEYLDPTIAVERLFSRIPEKDAAFSNWGIAWWKLLDETISIMETNASYQGKRFDYLNGSALKKL